MSSIDFKEGQDERLERVMGEYEYTTLTPEQFVVVAQVRDVPNPILPQLKESLRTRGLINPVDVVNVDEATLQEYVDFTNRTWKRDVSLDGFADQRMLDGTYYLLVAGHTRLEAIKQLEAEDDAPQYKVTAKIHSGTSVMDIVNLQLEENIHSVPRIEQRAIAIVEQYNFGLERGQWKDKADYARQMEGHVSKKQLTDALLFADLPSKLQDYVYNNHLEYSVAIELSRALPTISEHTYVKMGDKPLNREQEERFKETVIEQLIILVHQLNGETTTQPRKLNITAAKKFIKAKTDAMNEDISVVRDSAAEETLFDLEDVGTVFADDIRKQYEALLAEIEQKPLEQVDEALRLARRLKSSAHTVDLEALMTRRTRVLKHLGSTAGMDIAVASS